MAERLKGKRVVVTQAADFMGPITVEVFQEEGAEVIADTRSLVTAEACRGLIEESGPVDVLVANLASPNFSGTAVTDIADDDWLTPFNQLVHPLHWLTQAVLPSMIERRQGKIVVWQRRSKDAVRLFRRPRRPSGLHPVGGRGAAQRADQPDRPELRAERRLLPPGTHGEALVRRLAEAAGAGRPAGHPPRRRNVRPLPSQRRMRLHDRPSVPLRRGMGAALTRAPG